MNGESAHVRIRADDRPATIFDLKWEARAEKASFDALSDIRSSAEKWTGAIASILAIFSGVALIKGPDDVTKLQGSVELLWWDVSWETVASSLVVLTIVSGLYATRLAAQAAYGTPEDFRFTGATVRQLHRRQAKDAAGQLKWARRCAGAAVIFLTIAVGITWRHTPEKPVVPENILVVNRTDPAVCGTLQTDTRGNVEVLDDGVSRPIDPAEVVSITTVASCPGED
jgi:hypothetical protein